MVLSLVVENDARLLCRRFTFTDQRVAHCLVLVLSAQRETFFRVVKVDRVIMDARSGFIVESITFSR